MMFLALLNIFRILYCLLTGLPYSGLFSRHEIFAVFEVGLRTSKIVCLEIIV